MSVRSTVIGLVLFGAAAAAGPVQAAGVDARELLKSFNNIVLNDLTTNVETEGTLYVGGDYDGNGSTVNPQGLPNVDLGGGIVGSLVVGGNINANAVNLNGGHAVIGGTDFGGLGLNNGSTKSENVSGIPVAAVTSAFQSFSAELAGMASTGGTANTSDQNNINFQSVANSANVAVFNIDGSVLQTGTFNGVNAGPGVTTIINVAGTDVTIGVNANQTQSSVIFNFYEATSLTINSTFNYSVLAPFADVMLRGGGLNGTLVSYNLQQDAEVRPPLYDGIIPPTTVVPVPAAAYLLLTGIAALGGMAARRRNA